MSWPDGCLCRIAGDVYEIASVGTLKRGDVFWRTATATAAGRTWQLQRRGILSLRWRFSAIDAAGIAVGAYHRWGRWRDGGGGELFWGDRGFVLRPHSLLWPLHFELFDGTHKLARLQYRRRDCPAAVWDEALDPGLLLFVVFVVRRLLSDAPE
jgi:hypothetical protein